jgi:hypothetical protein
MTISRAQIQEDFEEAIQDFPIEFLFSGDTYEGLRTQISAETMVSLYGGVDDYIFSIRAIKADFTTLPKTDDPIEYDTDDYVVRDVKEDSLGTTILIHLERAND